MSSENASNGTAQMKVELILDKDKVKIKGKSGFSIDLKSPVLKVNELYNTVFASITEPTNIDVTASKEVLQSKEAKPIFENVKTIIDNAIQEINSGLADFKKAEDDGSENEDEDPVEDEEDDPLTELRDNLGSLFSDGNDDEP